MPPPPILRSHIVVTADVLFQELHGAGALLGALVTDMGEHGLVWREQCLDHLLGDFSFAIWDGRRRALFCGRDHFGVKPFLYVRTDRSLIFSNDLSCLRLHPAVSNELDEVAIADFLVYGFPLDAGRSAFSAIRRLPPSHALTSSGSQFSLDRYWQLPLEAEIQFRRRGDYIERFLELLDVAVRDRLRTNTVGVLMSGGLDSPAIAATAKRLLSASGSSFDLRAHTFVFDRNVLDEERRYSQIAATGIGIPIQHYPLDDYRFPPAEPEPDWYPPDPRMLFERGRPVAAYRLVTAQSRVLLRGEGADPLLDAPACAAEHLLRTGQYWRLLTNFAWLVWARRQLPQLGLRGSIRKMLGREAPLGGQPYPGWLAPALERRLDLPGRWRREYATPDVRPGFELAHAFWPLLFEYADPGSMRLAAENRYPFMDVRLVRYLLRVPPIPWFAQKSLLRVGMQGVLPRTIVRRPKVPLAGNPWASLLPPTQTSWWEQYMVPAPGLEQFVDVDRANATLADIARVAQARENHQDVDILRTSLRSISLNLWLRHNAQPRVGGDHRGTESTQGRPEQVFYFQDSSIID